MTTRILETGMSLRRAMLWTLPMLALTALALVGPQMGHPVGVPLVASVVNLVFVNALFFAMLRTGRTDRYRAILFITYALVFVASFIPNLLETRGYITITSADEIESRIPFCHLAIPMTLIPVALTRTINFPGSMLSGFANIGFMFVMWIGFTLVLGRGFCSWACFYGGLDDFFARLRRKRVIKSIAGHWTYLPYAMLLFVVVVSAFTLAPTYCEWFCPFKAVTEFWAVTSLKIVLQTIIFVGLFIGLVLVLPVLTGRRTQCSLLCPLGAFQALVRWVAPFDVRAEREKCGKNCTLCVHTCPCLAIDLQSLERGRTRPSCSLCGRCIDACNKGALHFHVKGTEVGAHPRASRLLFVFPAFFLLSTFSSRMVQGLIVRLIHFATTGSYLMR